jgi:hypothetical protein
MGNECSICQVEETARTINELLERQTPVRTIEAQTGVSHSTISRHKLGNCRFSFSAFKAAKIRGKSKAGSLPGRMIVRWPALDGVPAYYAHWDRTIPESELRETDTLFVVSWRETRIASMGNPRAATLTPENLPEFIDLARAEDAKRAAESSNEITPA